MVSSKNIYAINSETANSQTTPPDNSIYYTLKSFWKIQNSVKLLDIKHVTLNPIRTVNIYLKCFFYMLQRMEKNFYKL